MDATGGIALAASARRRANPLSQTEVPIASNNARQRWWWAPVTVAAVTVINAVLVTVEHATGALWTTSEGFGSMLLAHVIAGALCMVGASIVGFMREGPDSGFISYSERYLRGIACGIVTSFAISIVAGLIAGPLSAQTIAAVGTMLSFSIVSMQLPLACVVGGVVWQLLSRDRGQGAGTQRRRRPIEDPE